MVLILANITSAIIEFQLPVFMDRDQSKEYTKAQNQFSFVL